MEVKVTTDEHGKFDIATSAGLPLLAALGILEVAKHMILNGDVKPLAEPEIVSNEVQ